MGFLFSYCSSLIKLPDISNWDVNNVTNMGEIFSECSSLKCLPNLSKLFNNSKIIDKPIYNENILLEVDYQKYNYDFDKEEEKTKSTGINFAYMFYNCSSLEYLPDISNWNTKNVVIMRGMFYGCSSLKSLPDISK